MTVGQEVFPAVDDLAGGRTHLGLRPGHQASLEGPLCWPGPSAGLGGPAEPWEGDILIEAGICHPY